MISIVMTYYERQDQLTRTLRSIAESAFKSFEVVIVDDASPHEISLPELPYPVTIVRVEKEEKRWTNPEPAYNLGIATALTHGASTVILQNAECLHVGDILSEASRIERGQYISFGCFSINEKATREGSDVHNLIMANNFGASHDGQNAWYNHPVHRPVGYDFCSAIRVADLIKLNGYDERFSQGMGYGDDYFKRRTMMLGLEILITERPYVVHQWHYTGEGVPDNKNELVERNRRLFTELVKDNQYRAVHLYTPDFESITYKPVAR
jgi:glycosyltransferase involved in cell wall biosynthesis